MSTILECNKCLINSSVDVITEIKGAHLCQECLKFEFNHLDSLSLNEQWSKYIANIKKKAKGKYDVLFALSGGKDSIAALYFTVKKYNLKPLAFTVNHGFKNEVILKNCLNITKKLDVDWILTNVSKEITDEIRAISNSGELPCTRCGKLWKNDYYKQVVELTGIDTVFTGGDTLVDGYFEFSKPEWSVDNVGLPLAVNFLTEKEIYDLAYSLGWKNPNVTGWDTDCTAVGVALKNYRDKHGIYHEEELKHLAHRVRHGLLDKETARKMLLEEMKVSSEILKQFNGN
ncbi:MAG: hypothetical protein LBN31_05830 [Hungatella sp.]|jgi:predicted PP-loop superfamily ATPase|nr:hypothetical protein [Hungatella sp.]